MPCRSGGRRAAAAPAPVAVRRPPAGRRDRTAAGRESGRRAGHRRRARRRGLAGRAPGERPVRDLQPGLRGDAAPDHRSLAGVRPEISLCGVLLPRHGARPDQDQRHPAGRHVQRRLGGLLHRHLQRPAERLRIFHQPERHPGRPPEHRRPGGELGAGLGLGQRRPHHRRRLPGRGPDPVEEHPVPERRRRDHGRPVLAADQPAGAERLLAGADAGRRDAQRPRTRAL